MTDSSANPRNYGERPVHEDDPLMELSRIMDFDTPADDNVARNERRHDSQFEDQGRAEPCFDSAQDDPSFDPVLDLERELMGHFDDYTQPTAHSETVSTATFGVDGERAYGEQSPLEEDAFAAALEEEFDLDLGSAEAAPSPEIFEFEDVDRSEPVPQFDYNDYSQARDSSEHAHMASPAAYDDRQQPIEADAGEYDPTVYQPAIEPGEQAWREDTGVQDNWQAQDEWPAQNDRLEQNDWSEQNDWPAQNNWNAQQPVDAPATHFAAEPAQQPLSLEDELENLLFGDEPQPVASRNSYSDHVEPVSYAPEQPHQGEPEAPVSEPHLDAPSHAGQGYASRTGEAPAYPYYPRSNFAPGVAAPGVLSSGPQLKTPQAPIVQDFVAQDPFRPIEDEFSLEDDFTFEAEPETAAAAESTDDDLSGLDEISLTEDDFGFEPSGDTFDADVADTADEDFFNDEDFFTDVELDLHEEEQEASPAPAYAHAIHSGEDYRPAASFAAYTDMQAPARMPAPEPAPEVETLTVAENKVEQTHSLDLPEVNYGEEEAGTNLSELEAEFAEVFSTIGVDENVQITEGQSEADRAFEDIFRESASTYMPNSGMAAAGLGAAAAAAAASYRRAGSEAAPAAATTASQDDFYNHWAAQGAQTMEGGDYGERAAMPTEDDLGGAAEAYRNRPVRGRRGLILASVAGVVVLLGGIGYHFLGGGGSGEPVVIRADNQPIKMQPENPGGTTVPNQDKAVYDRVAGTLPNNPEQKALITSGEEPVDISGTDDSEYNATEEPGGNVPQNNAQQAHSGTHEPLIQPREVETMIVRPDGTIIQPSFGHAAQPSVADNMAPPAAPAARDEIGALAAGNEPPAPQAQQSATLETPRLPTRAPIVPSRPAEQPVNIVGNVPQRAQASAAPQVASAAGAGGYFIQIASQPSAELAQKSYANMAQKYASVIGGHSVDIKRADIQGKGTYYRVRVQAGSKEDALALCSRLKSAGGSCFVTQ